MKIKICSLFICFGILQSCATQKNSYRIIAGGRAENYVENEALPIDQTMAQVLGGTVSLVSGNPNQITSQATGFQIGFVEETKEGFVSTICYLYSVYEPVSYTFNSSKYGVFTEELSPTSSGFDITVGYNLLKNKFKIRPGLSYKTETQNFQASIVGATSTIPFVFNYKQNVFVWGGGVAFEYALNPNNRIILQFDYRVPSRSTTGVSSLSYSSAQFSWAYGNWQK